MRAHDLIGQRFGKLTVLGSAGFTPYRQALWECLCECGNKIISSTSQLNYGKRLSCGCVRSLIGKRFGKLIVLKRVMNKNSRPCWQCLCDCGNVSEVLGLSLQAGRTKSCGCGRIKHNEYKSRLHGVWNGMKTRCLNPRMHSYKEYGGRGISVCSEWMDYIPFRDWAKANGYNPGLQIDRIDVNGNYEPSNCRFITPLENQQNRRNVKLIASQVLEIRLLLSSGQKQRSIGRRFGITQSVISAIKCGHIWRNI